MLRVLAVGRSTSLKALDVHIQAHEPLVLIYQLDPDIEDPLDAELAPAGTLARVLSETRMPDGTRHVLVEGLERVLTRGGLEVEDEVGRIPVEQLPTEVSDPIASAARARELDARYRELMAEQGMPAQDHEVLAPEHDDPERLVDQVAGQLDLTLAQQIALLGEPRLDARLAVVLDHLAITLARQSIAADVNARVQEVMDGSQREYHLKEQLKAIRSQLGETAGPDADANMFEERILEADMPDAVREEALREVERLRRIHVESAEYTIIRTWLETVADLPWNHATKTATSLFKAQRVLDRDHFGLVKVKERILEYLAVRQLHPGSKGPILCFVGPPGVGKTSLGMSIARALGRSFGRIALGGIKDETEIRGHRRTYVGALPGRIVRSLVRAGSNNPVIVLDEIDKVGADFRGDPASALLEVLDPEQNSSFVDHYLDLPIDLSQVLFIGTANLMDPIPPALLDRLEIIEIPGYSEEEKLQISRRFLLPKLARDHGLDERPPIIDSGAIAEVVRSYTFEAGLRELERQLASLHRKVARRVVEGHEGRVRISAKSIGKYLGPPRYFQEVAERVDQPGVVIGLAWTAAGGDILFVEATRMPGKMGLKLTGSLGEVMKESVEAAMSWLRSNALTFGIAREVFDAEFHLHVPAGAIPKDGPSAGVTMVTALASLATQRAVKPRVAMTGEITLRGRVLPVGGVREKLLAARRAGIATVILPSRNRFDLDGLPKEVLDDLTLHHVETIEEVLDLALEPSESRDA